MQYSLQGFRLFQIKLLYYWIHLRLFASTAIILLYLVADTQIRFLLLAGFSLWLVESWICWSSSFTNGLAMCSDLDDHLIQRSATRWWTSRAIFYFWSPAAEYWRLSTLSFASLTVNQHNSISNKTTNEANWRRVKKDTKSSKQLSGRFAVGGRIWPTFPCISVRKQVVGVPNEKKRGSVWI